MYNLIGLPYSIISLLPKHNKKMTGGYKSVFLPLGKAIYLHNTYYLLHENDRDIPIWYV